MKLDLSNPITNTTNLKTTNYTLNINATTFELLYRKLYANPIESIIRELTSNAWDAHIAADTQDTPIQITLPTGLEDELIIKDFGTGLSPQEMIDIYSVGFLSTKQQSNDFLGCYGLGSKSPLSFTDQYIVESRYNGWQRTYLIFINDQGIPNLSEPIQTISTDEHNGLTIKLHVPKNQQDNFYIAAKKVLSFFNVEINTTLPHIEYVFPCIAKPDEFLTERVYAKIGNILYPVDMEQLKISYNRWATKYYTIILPFPIGELSITPNREQLNYNNTTIQAIQSKLAELQATIYIDIETQISKAKTRHDAEIMTASTRHILKNLNGIIKVNAFYYNNEELGSNYHYILNDEIFYIADPTRRGVSIEKFTNKCTFTPNRKYTIYIADTKTPYLRDWLKSHNKKIYLIKTSNVKETKTRVTNFLTEINSTIEFTDVVIERTASTIQRNYNTTVRTFAYQYNYIKLQRLNPSHFFLLENKYKPTYITSTSVEQYIALYDYLCAAKLINTNDVIILPPSSKALRKGLNDICPLIDLAIPSLVDYYKEQLIYDQVYDKLLEHHNIRYNLNTIINTLSNSTEKHPFAKLLSLIDKGRKLSTLSAFLKSYTNHPLPKFTKEYTHAEKMILKYSRVINLTADNTLSLLSLIDRSRS